MTHRRRTHILVSPSINGRAKDSGAKWEVACNDDDDVSSEDENYEQATVS